MSVTLNPIGPDIPDGLAKVLQNLSDAILDLQQPGAPVALPRIDTKANLTALDPATYAECAIVCDEINSLCLSTQVAGVWTWLRANGGAL